VWQRVEEGSTSVRVHEAEQNSFKATPGRPSERSFDDVFAFELDRFLVALVKRLKGKEQGQVSKGVRRYRIKPLMRRGQWNFSQPSCGREDV